MITASGALHHGGQRQQTGRKQRWLLNAASSGGGRAQKGFQTCRPPLYNYSPFLSSHLVVRRLYQTGIARLLRHHPLKRAFYGPSAVGAFFLEASFKRRWNCARWQQGIINYKFKFSGRRVHTFFLQELCEKGTKTHCKTDCLW